MQHSRTKKAIWTSNRKKWRKWCILDSLFLFNNSFVLPVLTIEFTFPNQVFYVTLLALQTICAKLGLKTWFTQNNVIRIYLHVMQISWTKNAIWNLNSKKWRKWCTLVSLFLYNNSLRLPVFTMGTTCPKSSILCFICRSVEYLF
jgi:hypothetical protein